MYKKNFQKVAIVGVGNVGNALTYGIVNQGLCNEVVLINRSKEKALGLALDLRQSMVYMERNMRIWAGDCSDCGDADIVFFCVGGKVTSSRMESLQSSCDMVKPYVEQIMASGFEGHIIVLTNPVDVVSYYIYKTSGLPASHVIGTGTSLDTARLETYISILEGVSSRNILAFTMGEHGDSQMIPWSAAYIGGKRYMDIKNDDPDHFQLTEKDREFGSFEEHMLHKVKHAGWKIQGLVGHTCYGVASAALGIARSILRDEYSVIPCSVYLNGQYGVSDVFLSVPVILTANGVSDIVKLNLTPEELAAFQNSAKTIKENLKLIMK